MSMETAINHSTAQLWLMSQAADRVEAARALLHAQGCYAGTAATVSREGGKLYDRFTKSLASQIKA